MRVISKAPAKNWKREVTCVCKARLEVERDDCSYVNDQRDGDYWSCRCPECGTAIAITVKLVGGQ